MWFRVKQRLLRKCGFSDKQLRLIREYGPLYNAKLKTWVYYELRGNRGVYVLENTTDLIRLWNLAA